MSISTSYRVRCDICSDVSDGWGRRSDATASAKLDGWALSDRNTLAVCPSCQTAKNAVEFMNEARGNL